MEGSPVKRFNLNNIIGSPTPMVGRSVSAYNQKEKCCFCCDLTCGVSTIAAFYIAAYLIQIASMIAQSMGWQVVTYSWKIFTIIVIVIGLPLCIVGLVGALKRKKKLVYAYFLYNILYCVMIICATIGWLVQLGQGVQKRTYISTCEKVLVDQGYAEGDVISECERIAGVSLAVMSTIYFIFMFCQIYWTYVIRRLYLQILIGDSGMLSYNHL